MHLLIITRKVDKQDVRIGFFFDWILAFAKEVEQLSVICLEKGDASGLPGNVSIYSMGKERGKNRFREFLRFIWFLLRTVPICDGIFVHMIPLYVFISAPFAKVFRKQLYLWYTHGRYDWRLRMTQSLVSGYLSANKESFPLTTSKPVIAFGHALNLEKFPYAHSRADDDGVLTIVTVSRITPVKNLDVLIRALSLLKNRLQCKIVCEMIGVPALPSDIEYERKLKALVSNLTLTDNVVFLGGIVHAWLVRRLERADFAVNLSDTHSLDKAVLEAMACGVIVITSNRSIRPVFGDLAAELMVECTPESVADRIATIWNTPHEEKERIRKQLRAIVERDHDMKKTIPKIVEVYKKGAAPRVM